MKKPETIFYKTYFLLGKKIIIQSDGQSIIRISTNYYNEEGIQKEDKLLDRAAQQIEEYLLGKRKEFHLPLHLKGTEFQKMVWKELCKVSYGETATYQQIAERIGKEKVYRAVGMACGKNPIWIVIPCHRIVGKNGALTGYAGGVEIKQALLELERKNKSIF